MFAIVGAGAFASNLLQQRMLGGVAQRVALRIRTLMFKTMLRQEAGWFDLPENSSGSLAGRLNRDALMIRGALGDQTAIILQVCLPLRRLGPLYLPRP